MMRAPLPSLPPLGSGFRLGDKFEVLGVLGEGMAGTVYDARRVPEMEPIALKVLHSHLLHDRQVRGRFEREAKILGTLQGPHVCPVLEFGEMDDPRREGRTLLYMALPKIEGPTLDALLKKEGPLPLERALDIVLQICDALKLAHGQGIIHRDLKPANVLLRGGTHVVVVDFGLAKILAGESGQTALTAQNMVCGTPEYMAPEQARGEEIDARSDVYSAGVILYELLTGSPPFGGTTPLSVLTAHLTSLPEPPRARAPARAISKALEAVALHALAKLPDERYGTAGALAAALLHARARPDNPDAVSPAHFAPARESTIDAHAMTIPAQTPVKAALPASGAPAAVFTGAVRHSDRPGAGRGGAPRAAPSRLGWVLVLLAAGLIGIALGVWLSLRGG